MRCRVDFDLIEELRLVEGLLQDRLVLRPLLVVVFRHGDQEGRLRRRRQQVRAIRVALFADEAAAVERGDGADAIGNGRSSDFLASGGADDPKAMQIGLRYTC